MKFLSICAALLAGTASAQMAFQGVNLAGADFGQQNLPGEFGSDYTYPTADEVDYYVEKGMNIFRIPFRWERLQQSLSGELDATELGRMHTIVDYITAHAGSNTLAAGGSNEVYALLDPHNYARYNDQIIGASAVSNADFADFWRRLAEEFGDDDRVIFGIMNEPSALGDSGTELWLAANNAAIAAIRGAGAANFILVPGNYYTGAHSWVTNTVDGSSNNGDVMLGVVDSMNNFGFDMHQYLDFNYAGLVEECTHGSEVLIAATNWLRTNGYTALIGEFGVASNDNCLDAMADLFDYMTDNSDVWLGYTYWAGGPWWGEYFLSIEPTNDFTTDREQMNTAEAFLPAVGPDFEVTTQVTTEATTTTQGATTTTQPISTEDGECTDYSADLAALTATITALRADVAALSSNVCYIASA